MLESMCKKASIAAQLPVAITPHGMRHCGPSHDLYAHAADLTTAQARGRWRSMNSVRRYAKHATLLRQVSTLNAEQLVNAAKLSVSLPQVVLKML